MDWTYRLKLRRLEMLLSLEKTGNISRTAEALNTTQPAVSKWLKDLETDIGLPLFARHARGFRLTEYGAALIGHARRIAAHLDAARDDLAALRDSGSGRIVIGTAGASAGSTAPLAVLNLMRQFPTATVDLVEGTMDRLLDQLSTGKLDIVVGRSMPTPADLGLVSENLYVEPTNFIVRRDHPVLRGDAIGWDDLLAYRWIVWPEGSAIRAALDAALRETGHAIPPMSIQSGALTLNLTLLTNSDMIALTSHREALRFASWDVARIVPFPLAVFGEVALYRRDDGDNRPLLAAMLRCLRDAVDATADPE